MSQYGLFKTCFKKLTQRMFFLLIGLFLTFPCFAEEQASKITATYQFELKGNSTIGVLNQPAGLALNSNGDLFIADTINSRIVVFDEKGKFKITFGKKGSGSGELNAPMALMVNKNTNRVYVADSANYRIQVFKTDGEFLSTIDLNKNLDEKDKKVRPIGIAINSDGHIYVSDADNNYIRVYSSEGIFLFKFGGFGAEDGQLCIPVGLFIDQENKLYVVDMNNSRLQVFNQAGKFLFKLGVAGDAKGDLGRPKDVTVDSKGNIFISDGGNLVVQIFNKKGDFLGLIGAEKDADLQFAAPFGLAVNNDQLYVTDRWRNSIRVYRIQY